MKIGETSICIICHEVVISHKNSPFARDTCVGIYVNSVYIKSECEREKNRRYQKKMRELRKKELKDGVPIIRKNENVALGSKKHLEKFSDLKKRKRNCLKCGSKFTGIGPFNRICEICTMINSRLKYQSNKIRS